MLKNLATINLIKNMYAFCFYIVNLCVRISTSI